MAERSAVVMFVVGMTDDGQFLVGICNQCDTSYRVPVSDLDDFTGALRIHADHDHGCKCVRVRKFDDDVREAMQCLDDGAAGWLRTTTTETEK